MNPKLVLSATFMVAIALLPTTMGSPAHPDPKFWYGTSASTALANVNYDDGSTALAASAGSDLSLRGACYDLSPNLKLFPLPPQYLGGDGDPETGVGGACYSYTSIYGDDTGSTRTVVVSSQLGGFFPIFDVCIDVNGDGICQTASSDQTNYCWTGTTGTGGISLWGGSCSVWLDPSAVDQTVYVNILGAVNVDTGGVTLGGMGLEGIIEYY